METKRLLFKPLRGIDDSWRPSQDPPKALRIRDMRYNDKDSWQNSGGYKVLVPNDEEGAAWSAFSEIESVHWFSEHSGNRQHLIFEAKDATDMRLYVFDGSKAGAQKWRPIMMADGTQAPARAELSAPHLRTQSVSWGGRIYLFNGKDPPLVFNGRYAERASFDGSPSAPTGQALRAGRTGIAELGLGRMSASSMNVDADDPVRKWGYRYKITFINERGQESPPSSPSSMVMGKNEDSYRKMAVLSIARGGETIVARRIYRTRQCLDTNADLLSRAIGSNFYFLQEISNNFQTSFEDSYQDAFLGPLLDEGDFGTWPAKATMGASFKNRIFVAGSNSSDVQYSAVLRPEVFPVDNILGFGQDECGQITGLYTTQNALIVFKQRGIFLIKSMQANNGTQYFSSQNISRDIGCIAPNSIAEVPGVGVFFLSMGGVYALEGSLENVGARTRVIRYSTPIPGLTNRINSAASIQAVGTYYPADKEYWLSVPVDGNDKNNFVLIYHGAVGSWSFRENFPIADAIVTSDHRGYYIFGSNDSANKGLHVYTRGASTKGTASIEPLWETTDIDFNGPFAAFSPKYVVCDVIGYGDNDFELTYRVNRNLTATESAKAQDQQDYTNQYAVYDTATWSATSLWYEHRPVPIRFDITTAGQPACRELRLTFESAGRRLQILSFVIGVVAGFPYEKTIPISSVVEEQRG